MSKLSRPPKQIEVGYRNKSHAHTPRKNARKSREQRALQEE